MARRYIRPRLTDQAGNVLEGALLRVLEAGTSTTVDLYAASAGGSVLSQPRTTDARGEVEVWLVDGTGDIDLEWSADLGVTTVAASGRTTTFSTFTEFVEAPSEGVTTHAALPDLATSGHPASIISGLGGAALLDVGTGAGTVAAGDDSRITAASTASITAGAEATGIGVSQEAYGLPGVVWTYGYFYITCTANRIYYFPFKVDAPITITKTAIKVDTLASSGKGLIGCYASTGALQPTGASLLTSGEIDTSSTGLKQVTGLSAVLTPGIYLASFQASVTVVLTCASYGVPGLMQLGTGMASWAQNHYVSRTYDATNPSSPPAWDTTALSSSGFQGPVGFAWTVN